MTLDPIQRFIDKLIEFKDAPDNPADEIDNIDKSQSIESLAVINQFINEEIDKSSFQAQLTALVETQDIRTQSRSQIEGILRNIDSV